MKKNRRCRKKTWINDEKKRTTEQWRSFLDSDESNGIYVDLLKIGLQGPFLYTTHSLSHTQTWARKDRHTHTHIQLRDRAVIAKFAALTQIDCGNRSHHAYSIHWIVPYFHTNKTFTNYLMHLIVLINDLVEFAVIYILFCFRLVLFLFFWLWLLYSVCIHYHSEPINTLNITIYTLYANWEGDMYKTNFRTKFEQFQYVLMECRWFHCWLFIFFVSSIQGWQLKVESKTTATKAMKNMTREQYGGIVVDNKPNHAHIRKCNLIDAKRRKRRKLKALNIGIETKQNREFFNNNE